ncbi:MAG TPA: efflux RND transporter periplasmic adaptor subunit, partial [Thermoanaerobaculia bacterium]|nr:efflux RND transporter periplasmic adaptor subunit [Thermoanaerobaculia bacterium]
GLAVALLAAGGLFVAGRDANGEEAAEAAAAEGEQEDEEKAPIPVEVAVVETGAIASYLSATANLIAPGEVDVVAETEGRVERVLVVEGDWVAKGQLLATLARGDAEIALEKARVREENAVAVHQRGLDLAAEQLISREDLEKRDMDARLAKQERAEAEWNLAKTEVRAPIGGRVTLRHTQPGRHVSPGEPLFHLTDRDLVAYVYLPEKDVLALDLGRRVELALDAAPDVAFHGRIRRISPVVDPATGTVKVTVEAVSPPAAVRPGSFVTARIVRERRPDAVLLPKDAVIRELAQAHVFVARRDGDGLVAARREIALGLEEESRVEAVSGIRPGERLIVAGQGALKEGTRIRVLGDAAGAEGKG